MRLYFQNSCEDRRLIGEPSTEEDAMKIIHAFCDERNFKIYYVRSWTTPDGEKWFDCGSWSEFFVLTE